MRRIDAIKQIAEAAVDELIISNIGYPSRELFAVKDRKKNFYMMGSMGLASSIGLGIALNTNRKVWVIDGDGSVLMNLGTLATIANQEPANLTLIILDDSSYGSTGCQPTYTSGKTKLGIMARGAGIEDVRNANVKELKNELARTKNNKGPHVIISKIEPGNASVPTIPISSVEIRDRVTEAIR